MASLQAALKNAIQVAFQLEDSELAAEPLPTAKQRQAILFFEAAEGGAGVLRRLVDDPTAFALVAEHALRLCHFDPATGADLHHAPHAKEDCEAACYDCLMSYTNQMDHRLLDRQLLRDLLLAYRRSALSASPQLASRAEHYDGLRHLCQSDLEREWLAWLEQRGYRLPSHAQPLIEGCHTRPDFLYQLEHAAIYIDGPHHRYPERQARDRDQTDCMEDSGYTVIRFTFLDDWQQIVNHYPSLFGATRP
jgi:very-short-patch-repair endonuclease